MLHTPKSRSIIMIILIYFVSTCNIITFPHDHAVIMSIHDCVVTGNYVIMYDEYMAAQCLTLVSVRIFTFIQSYEGRFLA